MQITLAHPERWWLATRADMPWLANPDVEDQHQRWPDRDERDWAAIATAVQHVMGEVAAGRGRSALVDQDDPGAGKHLVLDVDLDHLEAEDQQIITGWFCPNTGPGADPWDEGVSNGRHRLWNCWQAAPEAALPVASDLLKWLDDIPHMDEGFAMTLYRAAAEGIQLMPPAALKHNRIFYAELRRVVNLGGHEKVTTSRHWFDHDQETARAGRDELATTQNVPTASPRRPQAMTPMHQQHAVPAPQVSGVWWRRLLSRWARSKRS